MLHLLAESTLEHAVPVWNPYLKNIFALDMIRKRATKVPPQVRNVSQQVQSINYRSLLENLGQPNIKEGQEVIFSNIFIHIKKISISFLDASRN